MNATKHLLPLLLALTIIGCRKDKAPEGIDFRAEMRSFVQEISAAARLRDPDFIVIPQNGHELLSTDDAAATTPATDYISAIDGIGREDLFYGYESDDVATPQAESSAMQAYLDLAISNGISVLVTDYCSTPAKVDDSYTRNQAAGYVSFAAHRRDLDAIPSYPSSIPGENTDSIQSLAQARNFLYLIDPSAYSTHDAFINAVTATNYDAVIMDYFDAEGNAFSAAEVERLRAKANGGRRLVIAYMSIGEAEDYRYYWQNDWKRGKPEWLRNENPNWKGNYKVWYWDQEWQDIILAPDGSYLDRLLDAGYDGTYLDIIDAFEYFEEL